MERLSKAQPGAAFDKDYVALQIQGHQELLKLQEGYLPQSAGNREMTNVAKLAQRADQGASGDAAGHSERARQIGDCGPASSRIAGPEHPSSTGRCPLELRTA